MQESVATEVPTAMPATRPQAPAAVVERRAASTRVTVVMPTTSYTGPFEPCARRVLETVDTERGDEFLVVFDGEPPASPAWLADSGAVILATGERSGPAVARNLAADEAHGEVLFFVDADVELAIDAVERVRAAFDADDDLCGVFGAYDAAPAAPGLVSRFRNLLHHHTHMQHAGPAETFWSGCGAMRAGAFADLGGFSARYRKPSIEDIELGSRVVATGGRLQLDPAITCTHHKRWTLGSMIVTDVFQRAVPWTQLMLKTGRTTKRLNLDRRSRASGVCAIVAAVGVVLSPVVPWMLVPASACLVAILLMNRDFYALCHANGGPAFAAFSFLLHWLYFTYATLAFGAVVIFDRLGRMWPARHVVNGS